MPPFTSSQSVTSLSYTLTTPRTSRTTLNNFNTINSIRPTTMSTMFTTSRQQQQQQRQQQPPQHHHHTSFRSQTQLALLKLSSILPPSSTNLQINLIEPILYFRGDSEESVGCFLRGNLILNLSKPTKIRKIEMKFIGKMKTFWPESKNYYGSTSNRNDLCEEREIMSHNWTFLSSSTSSSESSSPSSPLNSGSNSNRFKILRRCSSTSKSNLISAGTHKYPFELFIPGNLPETIETERGIVNYKLSATAIRSGLLPNLHVSQNVTIIRTILEERNSEGIAIASEWNNQLGYEITIPKRAYPIGDSIDIDLKLSPKSKKVNIVGIKIQIEEESVYKSKGQKSIESRTLSVHKVNNFADQILIFGKNDSNNIQEGSSTSRSAQFQDVDNDLFYHKNILLPIPKCSSPIYFSYKSSSINISHHLKFIFTIKSDNNDDKKKKKKFDIKVDVPITLLSCRCAEDLPQYEDEIDSPSYESPPSYDQLTNDGRRQSQRHSSINNEVRHNSTNTITTITNQMNELHHPLLERLLTA